MQHDKPYIRVVGDVHGKIQPPARRKVRNARDLFPLSPRQVAHQVQRYYATLIGNVPYSVQVGDLATEYSQLAKIDPARHRAIAGNHDDLSSLSPHFLGDFGTHTVPLRSGQFEFFFVRGARSIDSTYRLSWSSEEELNETACEAALAAYSAIGPRIMMTHDCPAEITQFVGLECLDLQPARTNNLLQNCFDQHRPQLWLFGHHHRSWTENIKGTKFICLPELGYFDFDDLGAPISDRPR
jgi:hypothetical protein